MIGFLLLDANRPFVVAIAIMFGIALLEGITTVLGFGISRVIESLVPDSFGDVDIDADLDVDADADLDVDADADMDIDGGPAAALSKLLGWLCVGRVPVLVLFVLFLTAFGLAGLIFQGILSRTFGFAMPALLASGVAFAASVPVVRVSAIGLSRLIPKDESDAVSATTFVGRVATVTLGTARRGEPTQAKLIDEKGQTHYVMVEPDIDGEVLENGDQILLVSRSNGRFRAIANTSAAMVDSAGSGQ